MMLKKCLTLKSLRNFKLVETAKSTPAGSTLEANERLWGASLQHQAHNDVLGPSGPRRTTPQVLQVSISKHVKEKKCKFFSWKTFVSVVQVPVYIKKSNERHHFKKFRNKILV
jgi:hypothetical protein